MLFATFPVSKDAGSGVTDFAGGVGDCRVDSVSGDLLGVATGAG